MGRSSVTTALSTYTAKSNDEVIECNGTFTVTLPTASDIKGKIYYIKNIGSGTITVDGDGSETIDGSATQSLSSQYDAIQIYSNNFNWFIL